MVSDEQLCVIFGSVSLNPQLEALSQTLLGYLKM